MIHVNYFCLNERPGLLTACMTAPTDQISWVMRAMRKLREPTPPPSAAEPGCPTCGWARALLWVHGHGQCPRCGTVIAPCCEGAPLGGGTARAGRPAPRKAKR
jgi:hypothetical protein